ncbi:aldehyde dehydrogenase family protein [Pseudomaricurvus alkylphenolicus]|uniref:sulfoacetaldehyde dehydrogenase SafD n=1 Tax=Pseudomaricurvus alkylphenolicus TaxID=1306991 RepID=UPI001420E32D|nr:aldehyde dehydrogenase family protein [Pseudomaricurvus alkylphenolicus]NIB42793.1 aldehyde dehydrogenase family protein [Pseudomaricurvus alkylphenolicus]
MSYQVINPFNQERLAQYSYDTWEQVERKLALLKLGRRTLKNIPAFQRAHILRRLSELMEEHAEQLAELITRETGKTISDSRVEMGRAINAAIASAEECRQLSGEALDSDAYGPARGKIGVVCWRPLGTVLCITPFNFPINIALHKIGPAIAAGNTVLFKPGPQNTASSQLLVKLCYEAGIPQDVLQLSVPALEDMSRLVAHDDISAVNFTGGTAAANAIAAAAGYKKLLLELGGNDPLIVMPDGDLEAAVAGAINQRFATAGQRCTAAKRLFIHGDVYDRFRDLLVQKSTALKVGDPMDDDTFVGPVIHSGAAAEIRSRIEDAIEKGATVALGNRYEGAFVYPTILENVSTDCELMVEETFGPVMPLCRFTDVEDIIPVINNTAYGLQAGIFTQNLGLVRYLFEQLDVGTLACNDGPGFRTEHFPFGGVKQSGVGREGIKYAVREMSVVKTLVI